MKLNVDMPFMRIMDDPAPSEDFSTTPIAVPRINPIACGDHEDTYDNVGATEPQTLGATLNASASVIVDPFIAAARYDDAPSWGNRFVVRNPHAVSGRNRLMINKNQ